MVKFTLNIIAAIGVLLLSWQNSNCQSSQLLPKDAPFSEYLLDNELYSDFIRNASYSSDNQSNDPMTIGFSNYKLGYAYFKLEIFDSAFVYFTKVNSNHTSAMECALYKSHILSNHGLFDSAYSLLAGLKSDSSSHISNEQSAMVCYYLNGLILLKKQYSQFDTNSGVKQPSIPRLRGIQNNLRAYHQMLTKKRRKSSFVAGCLSAIIPGSGKFYAKKPAQGMAYFTTVGLLAGQTYEAYKKRQDHNARFIVFSSITGLFYIGNIWGSALTPHVKQNELYEQVKGNILSDFNLSISELPRIRQQ